ncbi:MAG: hypothetical protein Q8O43_01850 [Dehalococcoidia bacterium]|nr:hypothetical protein [Dehalococcoidia bacterium]
MAQKADSMYYRKRAKNYVPVTQQQKQVMTELAFLHLFLAWEDFLEQSFIRYMCGATTSVGYSPKRFISPTALSHALQIVQTRNRSYADWTDIDEVMNLARLYFANGDPYDSALRPMLVDFKHMNTIRNSIAHRSGTSQTKLRDTTRGLVGYLPRKLTAGVLLMTLVPTENITFLEKYCHLVRVAAQRIIRSTSANPLL